MIKILAEKYTQMLAEEFVEDFEFDLKYGVPVQQFIDKLTTADSDFHDDEGNLFWNVDGERVDLIIHRGLVKGGRSYWGGSGFPESEAERYGWVIEDFRERLYNAGFTDEQMHQAALRQRRAKKIANQGNPGINVDL
jgi:hypothetical protein